MHDSTIYTIEIKQKTAVGYELFMGSYHWYLAMTMKFVIAL